MGYFKETPSTYDDVDSLFTKLGDLCLKHIMLSSDAYIRMIKINMQGYKRLHSHLSKQFHDLYLDLQRESIERYGKSVPSAVKFEEYKPENIKEHLITWTAVLEQDLKEVNNIIREIFNNCGYIPCVAKDLQCILYKNLIKNERAIHKFNDCDWDYEVIYSHDNYIHKKMKDI